MPKLKMCSTESKMKIFENEFRWRVVDNLFGDRKIRRQPLRRKPFLMGLKRQGEMIVLTRELHF